MKDFFVLYFIIGLCLVSWGLYLARDDDYIKKMTPFDALFPVVLSILLWPVFLIYYSFKDNRLEQTTNKVEVDFSGPYWPEKFTHQTTDCSGGLVESERKENLIDPKTHKFGMAYYDNTYLLGKRVVYPLTDFRDQPGPLGTISTFVVGYCPDENYEYKGMSFWNIQYLSRYPEKDLNV